MLLFLTILIVMDVPALQADVVAHSLSHILPPLSCHSLSHRDCSKAPGLNTENPAGLVHLATLVQHKLGDLCKPTDNIIHPLEQPLGNGIQTLYQQNNLRTIL